MLTDLRRKLQSKGFTVYWIGQHSGICKDKYLVLKDMGTSKTLEKNINKELIEVWVYVPISNYSTMISFKNEIEEVMYDIGDYEIAYDPLPIITDDEKQAYFTRLSYYKKKQRRFY
ncbi:hypothetical protein CHF27_011215 [Romboutsia maritimum]|uniref:Uncharacterized protein n=1 Tax=Romboutsia maritimum TaxID=2020948 RepID=A0A371IQX5_9FIRM|nr:hypothetical protein [Romboutsia maritimum]RDY22881.1 hypothetical protein CHF27_011215 [Romboutsia maritimum]